MCHKNVSLTQEVSGRDQLQSLFLIIHQPLCPAVPLRLVNIREDVSLPPAVPSQHPPFTVKTGSGWTFQRSNYHLVWFTCESSYLHQPPASNLPFTNINQDASTSPHSSLKTWRHLRCNVQLGGNFPHVSPHCEADTATWEGLVPP